MERYILHIFISSVRLQLDWIQLFRLRIAVNVIFLVWYVANESFCFAFQQKEILQKIICKM